MQHAVSSDPVMVWEFAARLEALTPDAWERIHARCAQLDASTMSAFFGRVELYSRTFPDTDPYAQPALKPALTVLGGVLGFVAEGIQLLVPPAARGFPERSTAQQQKLPKGMREWQQFESIALREEAGHPGTAAAIRAAGRILMVDHRTMPPAFEPVYRPFEPEIPFASLVPPEPAAEA